MERMKEFKHFLVVIGLTKGGYLMRHYPASKFKKLRSIVYQDVEYLFEKSSVFTLHGWYPWLSENRWNAWRQVYNMAYRYWNPAAMVYFEEKPRAPAGQARTTVYPASWVVSNEKWTPALVQAVNVSKREEQYNRGLKPAFNTFHMSISTVIIIGVVVIVALLIVTGRLPI